MFVSWVLHEKVTVDCNMVWEARIITQPPDDGPSRLRLWADQLDKNSLDG